MINEPRPPQAKEAIMKPTQTLVSKTAGRRPVTVLKAPTSAPVADQDVKVTTDAKLFVPPEPPQQPEVAVIESDYPPEPETDVLEISDVDSEIEDRRRGRPAANSGVFRDSFFSKIVRGWQADTTTMINQEVEAGMQAWLKDLIELHTTVESSIQDLGSAITENGANIVFDIAGIKKISNEFVWIRKIADLAVLLKVGDYKDSVILRDIEQTFGRSKDADEERDRKERSQDKLVQATALKLLQGIYSAVNKPPVAADQARSVFKKGKPET